MSNNFERQTSVNYKLSPQETEIRGKKVLVIDDSIVRGTTSKKIVQMLWQMGAKKIYFATTCPPVKFPCFYGIDMQTTMELIAAKKSIPEIQKTLGVNKLLYQTIPDLIEAVTREGNHHLANPCMACLSGEYPTGKIPTILLREICKKRQKVSRLDTFTLLATRLRSS